MTTVWALQLMRRHLFGSVNIARSSSDVYASPRGIVASIVRLKRAGMGGATQVNRGDGCLWVSLREHDSEDAAPRFATIRSRGEELMVFAQSITNAERRGGA